MAAQAARSYCTDALVDTTSFSGGPAHAITIALGQAPAHTPTPHANTSTAPVSVSVGVGGGGGGGGLALFARSGSDFVHLLEALVQRPLQAAGGEGGVSDQKGTVLDARKPAFPRGTTGTGQPSG